VRCRRLEARRPGPGPSDHASPGRPARSAPRQPEDERTQGPGGVAGSLRRPRRSRRRDDGNLATVTSADPWAGPAMAAVSAGPLTTIAPWSSAGNCEETCCRATSPSHSGYGATPSQNRWPLSGRPGLDRGRFDRAGALRLDRRDGSATLWRSRPGIPTPSCRSRWSDPGRHFAPQDRVPCRPVAGRRPDVPAVASAVGCVARPIRAVLGQAVAWRGACTTSTATRITECRWTTTDAHPCKRRGQQRVDAGSDGP